MRKQKFYKAGAVFQIKNEGVYILSQVGYEEYNLISLESNSNRWGPEVQKPRYRQDRTVSDHIVRRIIGKDGDEHKTRIYSYLGQFNEIFERKTDTRKTAIVEVRGGVATATIVPKNVEVCIHDYDIEGITGRDFEKDADGDEYMLECG